MKFIGINFFTLFLLSTSISAQELKPFSSDGCTMFFDGTGSRPQAWKHCCFNHDLRYWFGGSKQNRVKTDQKLRSCVQESGHGHIARVMYLAIRVGRYSPVKNAQKWGWGWSTYLGYKELTRDQVNTAVSELDKLELPQDEITEFKRFYNLEAKTTSKATSNSKR